MLPDRARAAAIAVALVGALALPIAGCGSDKKDEYATQVQKAANEFKTSVEKAGAQVQSGAGLKDRVPALASFKASVDKLASDLAKLDPPSDLKQANDDAVKQLRTLSSDLSDYETAAKAGDAQQARKIVPKLQADQAVLQKTLDQIDRKAGG
jgi:hypothetical protein